MDPPRPVVSQQRDADVRSVLEGRLDRLPPPKSTQVRVFFSSTFTDMAVERNALMKEVVPYLTDICKHQGLEFEVVDMRWGVRDEAQVDQTTTALLLREIHKCQKLSVGPNFVMFLGDRYGSHVLPSQIPAAEFKIFKNIAMVTGQDTSLLDKWFILDMNAEPAVYQLQPITKHFTYYNDMDPSKEKLHEKAREDWRGTERLLLSNLQRLAEEAFHSNRISVEQHEKYFESVTEMEIRAGALEAPAVDKVVCFHRSITDINMGDKLAGRYVDLTELGHIDELAKKRREKLLKEKVPSVLPPNQIFTHSVEWTERGIDPLYHEEYLRNLCDTFRVVVLETVDKHMKAESHGPTDRLNQEILRNLHFCEQKCKIFYGREEELKQIREAALQVFSETSAPSADRERNSSTAGGRQEEKGRTDRSSDALTNDEGKDDDNFAHGDDDDDHECDDVINDDYKEETENDDYIEKHDNDDYNDKNDKNDDDDDDIKAHFKAIAQVCKQTGVRFHYGDANDDFESDPDKNPQLRLTSLPSSTTTLHYRRPVIVHGSSGSGKTALMARLSKQSADWIPGSYCVIRFFGTSPHCSYIRDVLSGLCLHVAALYGMTSTPQHLDLSSDFQFLVAYFRALLWRIDADRNPLVIVLDSVDQLHATDHAHALAWIPKKLPPNVAMVISTVTDAHDCLRNARAQFPFPDRYVEVRQFSESDAEQVINLLCCQGNRCVSRQQKNYLLKKFSHCSLPLFLKLITDEALTWNSYTQIKDVPIGKTIEQAINDLFDKLERNHGHVLISHALAYLSAASHGLSDTEMEDLLSLDDEVLQDTYLYHLPPDSSVIRLPPLLWKRVSDDIREYIVQRKSGNWFVLTWYHRQFREVAKGRFLPPDVQQGVHRRMGEYFLGAWHDRVKPLELFKIKKGSYPNAKRRVPEQPLVFEKGGYNKRKLQELPWHLTNSGNLKQFREVTCCFQWLIARCEATSLSAVVEDLKTALHCPAIGDADQQVQDDVQFICDMLALGSDSIRKDSRNLAVQIIGQISPHSCSPHLLQLLGDAHEWLVTNDNPQLIPQTVCLPRPGGVLKSSVNVDLHIQGSDRDFHNCMFLNEDKQQLAVIQQKSRSRHDNLQVFDIQDNLTCVQVEEVPFNIRALSLVGQNRYLLLQVYDRMSQYDPEYHCALFDGTTASPVALTTAATVINVSDNGNLLVYNQEKSVVLAFWDETANTFVEKHRLEGDEESGHFVLSPDQRHLVTISRSNKQALWSVTTGQKVTSFTETIKMETFEKYAPSTRTCLITASNTYVHRGWSHQKSSIVFSYRIPSGDLLGTMKSSSTHYEVDIIAVDNAQQYIVYGTSTGVLINCDHNKYATVAELSTCSVKSVCKSINGPYSDLKLCGSSELFVLAAVSGETDIHILSAGLRGNLKTQAQVVFRVTGHSRGILQLIVSSDEKMLFSAGEDNAVKLWDFEKILAGVKNRASQSLHNITKSTKTELDDHIAVDHVGRTLSLVISSDCKTLYIATDKGFVLKRKLTERTNTVMTSQANEPANQLLLSKNNNYLCAVIGEKILVMDTRSDRLLHTLAARGEVTCMAEGGDVLVAGQSGMEAKGRIWNLQTDRWVGGDGGRRKYFDILPVMIEVKLTNTVERFVLSRAVSYKLPYGCYQGAVIRDFEFLYSLYQVAINSTGTKICVTMFDYPVLLTTRESAGDEDCIRQQPDTMMAACSAMMVSPDDRLAAAGSTDGTTRVISALSGKYLYRLNQRSTVTALAFTPDSRSLLTAGYRSVYIWDMRDGHFECKLTRHHDFVVNLRFASDGRFLVTSGRDKLIVVWYLEERVSVCVYMAHCHVEVLDVAHDLSYIAYGSEVVSLVGVLEPNTVLKSMADGSYVKTVPEEVKKAQSLALCFSGQRVKAETTSVCSIM